VPLPSAPILQRHGPGAAAFGADRKAPAGEPRQALEGRRAAREDPERLEVEAGERAEVLRLRAVTGAALHEGDLGPGLPGLPRLQKTKVLDRAGGLDDLQADAVARQDLAVTLGECEIGAVGAPRRDREASRRRRLDELVGQDEAGQGQHDGRPEDLPEFARTPVPAPRVRLWFRHPAPNPFLSRRTRGRC
jgi:hypothetical protein